MRNMNESSCNNTPNEKEELSSFLIDLFTRDVTAILGTLGNIFIIMVLLQRHMVNTFNKLRVALAMFDTILLISCFVDSVLKNSVEALGIAFPYILWPIRNFAQTGSMFMTMVIAVERFIAISYPIHYEMNKRYRATKYISSVIILSSALNITKFFELKSTCAGNGLIHDSITVTELYTDKTYVIYNIIIYKLLITGLMPITVLICIYVKIYNKLKENQIKLNKSESNIEKRKRKQENMAGVFSGVVMASLICNIPEMFIKITALVDTTLSLNIILGRPLWLKIALKVRAFFVILNSAINMVIYGFLDKKFREECRKVFQNVIRNCRCLKNSLPSNTTTMLSIVTPSQAEVVAPAADLPKNTN